MLLPTPLTLPSVFTLIAWVLLGLVSAHYAKKRGRSPYRWFILGLLLGILSLALLFALPSKQAVTKEKEAYRAFLTNTFPADVLWYYLDAENKQHGPMSFAALEGTWREGGLSPTTYVWNEELEQWKRFEEIFPR